MDKNRSKDFASYWKATLLGKDFWKDAEPFNQPIHDIIEANRSETLHTQLPFSPSASRSPPSDLGTKQRRRFSMRDVLTLNPPSPSTLNPNRVLDRIKHPPHPHPYQHQHLRRRSHSRSPIRTPSISSATRRHHSLRTPFNMTSSKNTIKRDQPEPAPIPHSLLSQGEDTPTRPLHFRGGATWSRLPRTLPTLALDLFHPVQPHQNIEETILPLEELAPLCHFRGLRVLKLTGMMQSYQRYIWQAAWLNPGLEEIELGMALEPCLRRRDDGTRWPYIRGGWTLNEAHCGEPVYYGHNGSGALHPRLGAGEYLDKTSLEKAKVRAMATGRTPHRLPVATLTLTGFVVDADPFIHWFDPARLRVVHFRDYCVDAGFYLPWPMRRVSIVYPREAERVVVARVVDVRREVRVVEVCEGKKVSEREGEREKVEQGVEGSVKDGRRSVSALQGQSRSQSRSRGLWRRIGQLKGQRKEEDVSKGK